MASGGDIETSPIIMRDNSVDPSAAEDDNKQIGNHVPGIAFKDKTSVLKFKYVFQYPYARLFIAYFVTICNFVIYAEDPVAHSHSRCEIPILGNAFSFVFTKYPPNGFAALKALMWITAIVMGIGIGKLILHKWLFNKKLRLSMFSEDQGSWMIAFLFTILMVVITSFIYNLLLSMKTGMEDYQITGYIGATNSNFMRAAALGTWFGDFITAWMVTDMMLQEVRRYKRWKPSVRKWWNKGTKRVVLFWLFSLGLTIVVIVAVTTNFINWDKYNKDIVYTNELGRSFLASFILVMDFTIVMQDWDFPMFDSDLDIKLPGVNSASIKFELPSWLTKNMVIHITGKWFQYGILFIVLLLDLNMWKNQIFYDPLSYGQYTGPEGRIYTVYDRFSLDNYGNATIFSFDWRNSTMDPLVNATYIMADYRTNSRYRGTPLKFKAIAFVPSIFTFIIFGLLIHYFGKKPVVPVKDLDTNTQTVDIEHIAVQDRPSDNGSSTPAVVMKQQSGDSIDADVTSNSGSDQPKVKKSVASASSEPSDDQVTQVEGEGPSTSGPKNMSPTRRSELEKDLLLCELRVENCDLRVNNLSTELGMV